MLRMSGNKGCLSILDEATGVIANLLAIADHVVIISNTGWAIQFEDSERQTKVTSTSKIGLSLDPSPDYYNIRMTRPPGVRIGWLAI